MGSKSWCGCREHERVTAYAKQVQTHAFHMDDATCSVGFSLHVTDVYVAEWAKVAEAAPGAPVPHRSAVALLLPFVAVLQRTRQPVLLQRVRCAAGALAFCAQERLVVDNRVGDAIVSVVA